MRQLEGVKEGGQGEGAGFEIGGGRRGGGGGGEEEGEETLGF